MIRWMFIAQGLAVGNPTLCVIDDPGTTVSVQVSTAVTKLKKDLCRGIPRVWSNYYMLDKDKVCYAADTAGDDGTLQQDVCFVNTETSPGDLLTLYGCRSDHGDIVPHDHETKVHTSHFCSVIAAQLDAFHVVAMLI